MAKQPKPTDWLDGFVVADPPRGEDALLLARALVDALGSPQRHAPAVHIVGTAGKGSVASRLTGRLVAAGLRVATHQSPHVYDVRERFLLDGELPAWPLVEAAMDEVDDAVRSVRSMHGRAPTFFGVSAALSWVLGRRHDADVFVTEAGIGGRHDATAVLDRPDTLTIITHIGLDHTDVLGSTVEAIATEKAAVMAGRRVAVLGPQLHAPAVGEVRRCATEVGVDLHEVQGHHRDWRGSADATVDVAARLLGATLGVSIPTVAAPRSPGRYEVRFVADRRVILDGAHNVDKLSALADVIADDVRPACVVAALGRRKDLGLGAMVMARMGGVVLTTTFGDERAPGPRGWAAAELADAIAAAGGRAETARSIPLAVRRALELTEPGDTVLVTGSFLILGAVVEAFAAVD